MNQKFRQEFANPTNLYRPIPFWSWNDKLDPEELKRQIRELKQSGAGGYFMHARSGLKTEYLSEEWFSCIQTGIEMAKEEGMDAWIYDEEGWPSGFAGGVVPALSEAFQSKFMTLERFQTAEEIETLPSGSLIALYRYNNSAGTLCRLPLWPENQDARKENPANQSPDGHRPANENPDDTKPDNEAQASVGTSSEAQASESTANGEIILAVHRHVNPFYVDTLSKAAIDAFLACTHEAYYSRFGEDFGSYMKGFFTDEPRLACDKFGELAWSDELPAAFLGEFGYDITDHLPALFIELPGYQKYRFDFWTMVSKMFTENYMKNIYDWCEAHGCKATGHIMMEESVFSQMTSTAGVMPFYEYLHVPGIDWLRRMISSPVIGKQVGSVACQLGKNHVLTESFALCGWNVSFEELKWIAQWQFVNGVNQICQHLMAYSIKGSRKRDYPPSHFTQQTWWRESGLFNDYLSRLCVALSEGDQAADVLLIHPMKSGYVTYDGTRTDAIRLVDEELTRICESLSGSHISYHFGDETIIKKYGRVEEKQFIVGKIPYQAVILPHMYAIDGATVERLLQFVTQGGLILSAGRFPDYTNGDGNSLQLLKRLTVKVPMKEIRTYLQEQGLLALSIEADGKEITDISYQLRRCEDGLILYMVNNSQVWAYDAAIHVLGKQACVTELLAETGEQAQISYLVNGSDTQFRLRFEPMGSHLILLERQGASCCEAPCCEAPCHEPSCHEPESPQWLTVRPGQQWKIDSMDWNAMTLDLCRYRIDGGEFAGPVPVIKLQEMLLELQRPCQVELEFTFQVDMDPAECRELYAVIEDARKYRIQVNGQPVPQEDLGSYKDPAFRKLSIQPFVRRGENILRMWVEFRQPQKVYDVLFGENVYETEKNKLTYEVELESIYLLGDFGVYSKAPFILRERKALVTEGPFVIRKAPTCFTSGNFTTQGCLFFAGTMTLTQTLRLKKESGKRIYLDFGGQNAPLVKLFVNDILVKNSLWAPYGADITEAAKDGDNLIRLEVFASNRNLFGPHHHIDGECYNVGPDSFTGRWSWVERTSEADATDIADRDKNYWTDAYCFVEFGFPEQGQNTNANGTEK